MREYEFSLTCILLYKDRIYNYTGEYGSVKTRIITYFMQWKVLLSKDNKVRGVKMKYFVNAKAVLINKPISKLYLIETMKQTSEDIRPRLFHDKKVCQIC